MCIRDRCVPAYNEVYVQVKTPHRYNNQEVILEQPPRALSVSVAKALAFCENNKAVCRVLNTNPYMVTLKKGLKLAKIAGLIDSVLSMREIIQPPLSARSSSSSGERKQTRTVMTSLQRPRPRRGPLINPSAVRSPAEAVLIRSPTWAWPPATDLSINMT